MSSCSDLIDVDPPVDSLVSFTIFESPKTADAAVAGIYSTFYNQSYFSSDFTINVSAYVDELTSLSATVNYFYENSLLATDSDVNTFWAQSYKLIYLSNSVIEGCENSTVLTDEEKGQFIGEAKFFRAFCHFYLLNYFGEVPLITSTEVQIINTQAASLKDPVYNQIIEDLIYARDYLPADYSISFSDRTRVNSYVASAMLARVYLYNELWDLAETEATRVIEKTDLYTLNSLNDIFLSNSNEAIWQVYTRLGYTDFANEMVPLDTGGVPLYTINSYLLNTFEAGDQRKTNWIGSFDYSGETYYYPYKYKTRTNVQTEQETILRLGELYLIRAEARAEQNDIAGAQEDLDAIRSRAELDPSSVTDQSSLLAAIQKERQVELFCEWGHRFLDLKRTGNADSVLGTVKTGWNSTDILFPIPQEAISRNTNLNQNEGYN
ncbi:RagB/SusD family nutrient uptake outer membrane protein [Formosa sp. S-31]|uniref:RagB/SusD family nutrient uptake outer membrane protein n=1 Tax=Formosa sp. S-31 TaxID=2790949 RepID=UPI003EBBD993